MNFFETFKEQTYGEMPPEAKQNVKVARQTLDKAQSTSRVFLIMSIALLTLGIVISSRSLISGFPIIFISLPMLYFSYNCYQGTGNLLKILDNVKEYLAKDENKLDREKVRATISKGTFCFEWCVDRLMNELATHKVFA